MNLNELDFRRITDYMLSNYGINLENKSTLISGRLSNLVLRSGFKSIHEYVDYALSDPSGEELSRLVSKLTTNYTFLCVSRSITTTSIISSCRSCWIRTRSETSEYGARAVLQEKSRIR